MTRNKNSEKTIEHILEVSTDLFIEKGYEKTTIQDIINKLQMSKGAIYHHFKSKEDILEAVIKKRSIYANKMLKDLILTTEAKNTKEKITKILIATMNDQKNHSIDIILTSKIQDPAFVFAGIKTAIFDDAPTISQLINEGIKDESIKTDYPEECAEVFTLLMNIWINPLLFHRDMSSTKRRLTLLRNLMKQLGVDIINDELIEKVLIGYQAMDAYK